MREHNANAPIITTPWEELDGKQILEAMENKDSLKEELARLAAEQAEHDEAHHHHHHHDDGCSCGHDHDADEIFESWGAETPRKYTEEEVTGALAGLDEGEKYGIVLRAKGIVPCTDGSWIHFDYVPGEQNIRRGPAGITGRLCVIGSELKEHDLDHLFCLD